jgi:riboflavin synthase
MFTGLIQEIGKVASAGRHGTLMNITIDAFDVLRGMRIGDSVSINGACQTVTSFDSSSFTVQAVEETLRRTTLGKLSRGDKVNLEPSLKLGERLGGHLVQGHVDGTGEITHIGGSRENKLISISPPQDIMKYIVEKGSVAINGISLTVTFAKAAEFGVSVIPLTLETTTLGSARVGDRVNLETDIISKYVEKLLGSKNTLTMNRLGELGY